MTMKDSIGLKGTFVTREKNPETGEIVSEKKVENLVVGVGAEKIAEYIAGDSPADDFAYLAIGDGTTEETKDDTELQNELERSESLSADIVEEDGYDRRIVWSNTFSAGSGKDEITELGMFDADSEGVMLNRVVDTARDNENNDLEVEYRLDIAP